MAGRLARWILRCYPVPWRERYEAELREILASRPGSGLRDAVDLARGALDAHLRPQVKRVAPEPMRLATASGVDGPTVAPIAMAAAPRRTDQRAYGVVAGPPAGSISRRGFMRRMLGTGVGLLSLEFVGGSLAFLWPNMTEGLGAEFRVGTLASLRAAHPGWAQGHPVAFAPARAFLVNVPAAKELASGREASVPTPSVDEIYALWRKCPHLGCMVPDLCEATRRFQCRCHGSTYNILGEKLGKGPAERGMDRFPVRIELDGTLIIETREVIRGAPEGALTFTDPHPYEQGGCE